MAHKSFFNWSGGKDSSIALYYALQNNDYSIERLLTNINKKYRRISMHGVRESLLDAQAEAINLPLQKLYLPNEPSMAAYEWQMMATMTDLQEEGFTHAFFGDIFLEDLKQYREGQLAQFNIEARFPIWKRSTMELLLEFIDMGFKAIVVCTKADLLDDNFVGRIIDKDFLRDLPDGVDPCGENGEFHSFVFDGPIFKKPVFFEIGKKVFRQYVAPKNEDECSTNHLRPLDCVGFWFCDLLNNSTQL